MADHTEAIPFISTISTEEAAIELKLSQETVCEYIARGWLRATRVGRQWLVHKRSVQRLLETGTPPLDAADTKGRAP